MKSASTRRLASLALVAVLTALTAAVARGTHKPFEPTAPAFRQDGPADAPVVVAEFSDFQCPACLAAEPTVRQLRAYYKGRLRFVFKHFPLRMHEWARPAAIAAECAGRQGRFWPYHDMLYDHQDQWTNDKYDSFLTGYAKKVGLDLPAWQACRKDPSAAAAVQADVREGDDAWVTGTPTFFINGKRFVGKLQLAELGTLWIDRELKKK
ncbi:MAG: DsbA family protein [Elusimicrobia bacterium]|nr:DsbA family protein [Elusimicrobiota bacterium]